MEKSLIKIVANIAYRKANSRIEAKKGLEKRYKP